MTIPKKYFHDRTVLLLLSTNVFLAILASIFVLLKLGADHSNGYIVQYRADLGLNAFTSGSLTDLLSFVVFALLVLVVGIGLSMRIYHIHRQLSVTVLSLGVLLLVLTFIVSNSLLVLR